MKRLIVVAGLLGFVLGFSRSSARAIPPGQGGFPPIVFPVPGDGCRVGDTPRCARCSSDPANPCLWACIGGSHCVIHPDWCANGLDCGGIIGPAVGGPGL